MEKYDDNKILDESNLCSLDELFPIEHITAQHGIDEKKGELFQALCIYATRQLLGLGTDITNDTQCIDMDQRISLSPETMSTDILLDSSVSENLFKELFKIVSTPIYQEKIQALTKHSLPQHTGELIKKMQSALKGVFDKEFTSKQAAVNSDLVG